MESEPWSWNLTDEKTGAQRREVTCWKDAVGHCPALHHTPPFSVGALSLLVIDSTQLGPSQKMTCS